MPKVSVVIPVYNGEATIRTTLETVVSQDFADMEIIAVDDGSIDRSAEILHSFLEVKVFRQQNQGVSAARNKGTQLAKGDYIAFIDQDDIWEKNKISRQVEIAEASDESYVFTDFYRFSYPEKREYSRTNSELNDYIYNFPYYDKTKIFSQKTVKELLLRGYPIYPSTMFIKKKILINSGGWNSAFPRCQDLDISLRCSNLTRFVYIDEVLAGIGRHETNVSENFLDQLEEDVDVLMYHRRSGFFNSDSIERINYWLGRRLVGLGWHYAQLGDFGRARLYYLKGLRLKSGFVPALTRLPLTFPLFSLLWKLRRLPGD